MIQPGEFGVKSNHNFYLTFFFFLITQLILKFVDIVRKNSYLINLGRESVNKIVFQRHCQFLFFTNAFPVNFFHSKMEEHPLLLCGSNFPKNYASFYQESGELARVNRI